MPDQSYIPFTPGYNHLFDDSAQAGGFIKPRNMTEAVIYLANPGANVLPLSHSMGSKVYLAFTNAGTYTTRMTSAQSKQESSHSLMCPSLEESSEVGHDDERQGRDSAAPSDRQRRDGEVDFHSLTLALAVREDTQANPHCWRGGLAYAVRRLGLRQKTQQTLNCRDLQQQNVVEMLFLGSRGKHGAKCAPGRQEYCAGSSEIPK